MVRIVIDANVLVSAAFGGTPLDAVGKAFSIGEVNLSSTIVAEIGGTIERLAPKLGEEKTKTSSALWKRFQSLCRTAEPERNVAAHFLITGDKDLLAVVPARVPALPKGLKILTPREFMGTGGGET